MNTTDIVALLALFISLYGAFLSTYTAISEFFRLNISYLGKSYLTLSESNDFLDDSGAHITAYNPNKYCLAVLVRIENKSKNSTTINEFVLNNKYVLNSYSQSHDIYLTNRFKIHDGFLLANDSIYIGESIKPLIQINPLSTIEGYLFFDNLEEVPIHCNIKVITVQKSKDFSFNISFTDDYRNEIS